MFNNRLNIIAISIYHLRPQLHKPRHPSATIWQPPAVGERHIFPNQLASGCWRSVTVANMKLDAQSIWYCNKNLLTIVLFTSNLLKSVAVRMEDTDFEKYSPNFHFPVYVTIFHAALQLRESMVSFCR